MPTFSRSTLKRLCMLSQNRCAFSGCKDVLSEPTGTITGDVCHIRAASKKGARFDPHQSDEARHSFSNLVLMCVKHHSIIDAEPLTYTTQMLEKMKCDHESKGVEEITPAMTKLAEDFFKKYNSISVISNSGQVAINSPGAIQINSLKEALNKPRHRAAVSVRCAFQCFGFQIPLIFRPFVPLLAMFHGLGRIPGAPMPSVACSICQY